jgi:starvation-inducible DNA-binding protein
MEIQSGIETPSRKKIAEELSAFLSNTYALYLKTQNFHWNLKGGRFFTLHLLFEKQYEELAEAADEIAERIQGLGHYVDGSFSGFQKGMTLREPKKGASENEMLKELLHDHEVLASQGRPLIPQFQKMHDEVSADLLIKRLTFHEKSAWMLRSHLE